MVAKQFQLLEHMPSGLNLGDLFFLSYSLETLWRPKTDPKDLLE